MKPHPKRSRRTRVRELESAEGWSLGHDPRLTPYPIRSGFLVPWQARLLGAFRWLMSTETAPPKQLIAVGALLQVPGFLFEDGQARPLAFDTMLDKCEYDDPPERCTLRPGCAAPAGSICGRCA